MSADDGPVLFPRPRHLTVRDGFGTPTDPIVTHDPDLPAQGYTIDVGATDTRIRHADDAGLRYAHHTLAQLDALGRPQVVIEDWPDFAIRGFMLDISRDRVPTRATLERLLHVLADARHNHFELYIEHTFEHPGHEVVWASASPMTADDLRWLDARCGEVGIELVVNQNCFGHMERWLAHEDYRDRAETPDGHEVVPGVVVPPAVLAPTEDNAAFGLELVENQTRHVTSRTVHIGCDETFELGKGRSQGAVEQRGREAVYVEHLARLAGPLLADGRRVLFWGDVLEADPTLVASLPDGDLVPVIWTYEQPLDEEEARRLPDHVQAIVAGLGIDPEAMSSGFGPRLAPFVDLGCEFWVAPGTSGWNSLVGRIDNAAANLLDAAVAGRDAGATGYLTTDWGDNGHLQPLAVSFGPAMYGGAVSWCADANADIDLAAVLDDRVFGDEAGMLGGILDELGRLWSRTGRSAHNGSPLQAALCVGQLLLVFGRPDPEGVATIIATIDDAIEGLGRARPSCVDADIVVREVTLAARLARHGARRILARSEVPGASDAELRDELAALIEEYRAVWLERSRPGGLADSVAHLEATLATYR